MSDTRESRRGETTQEMSVATRPSFEAGGITLYLQDCLEGMKEHLEDGSVDVVVTSPPYNIGVSYTAYHDRRPREEYLD